MTSLVCLAALIGTSGEWPHPVWPREVPLRPFLTKRDLVWNEVVATGPRFEPGKPLTYYADRLRPILKGEAGTSRRMLAAEVALAWVSARATYEVRPTRVEEPLDGTDAARVLTRPRLAGHCGDLAGLTATLATAIEPSLHARVVVGWYRPVWDSVAPSRHAWTEFEVALGRAVQADPTFGAVTRQAGGPLSRNRVIFSIPSSQDEAGLFSVSHWSSGHQFPGFEDWVAQPTAPWRTLAEAYVR